MKSLAELKKLARFTVPSALSITYDDHDLKVLDSLDVLPGFNNDEEH